MTETSRRAPSLALRIALPLIPYATVIVGLHLLESAFAAMVGYHALAIAAIVVGGQLGQMRELVRGWSAGWFFALAAGGLAAGVVLALVYPYVHDSPEALSSSLHRLGLGSKALILSFAVWYVTVNPIVEELAWRGVCGSDARRPTVHDLLFGGYHAVVLIRFVPWPYAVGTALALAAAAMLWRRAAAGRGLLVPWLTHALADAAIFAAVFYLL